MGFTETGKFKLQPLKLRPLALGVVLYEGFAVSSFNRDPEEAAEILADSVLKSLFLGYGQRTISSRNKDLRSLAQTFSAASRGSCR